MNSHDWAGAVVLSRDRKLTGEATGSVRGCTLEGCRGERVQVKWPKHGPKNRAVTTWPCSKGLMWEGDNRWKIT